MSKKLAVYADGIILDVKVGSGAFMKNINEARELAETMLEIGLGFDRKVIAILSDMDQPLGNAIGNSLEVLEAVETLSGNGPEDFTELIETLASIGLMLKGDIDKIEDGKKLVWDNIQTKKAHKHLKAFVEGCHGDSSFVDDLSLPVAKNIKEVKIQKSGYINSIKAEKIGKAAMILGAGRATKEDSIDHTVGVILKKKIGIKVEKGDVIAQIYHNNRSEKEAEKMIIDAVGISDNNPGKRKIIIDILKNFD